MGPGSETKEKQLIIKMIKIFFSLVIIFSSLFNNINASEIYHKNKLEIHFINLKNSTKLDEARNNEKKIWNLWNLHPNSEFLTNKLELGTELMESGQHKYAHKIFSNIIFEDPNWAEAWNKRATVLFLMKEYELSLLDIKKTLDLEPRHFGALSGRAQIYINLREYEKALDSLIKTREIYPLSNGTKVIPKIEKILNIKKI